MTLPCYVFVGEEGTVVVVDENVATVPLACTCCCCLALPSNLQHLLYTTRQINKRVRKRERERGEASDVCMHVSYYAGVGSDSIGVSMFVCRASMMSRRVSNTVHG